MSYNIEGWVEVTWCEGKEQNEDYAWQGLINLAVLIHASDFVSVRLFGLSKRCTSGEPEIQSLLGDRGLPTNPSAQVKSEIDAIKKHEKLYGLSDWGGCSYASWQEIKSAELVNEEFEQSDWRVVFDLIEQLKQHERYSDDQIRFVVWYLW